MMDSLFYDLWQLEVYMNRVQVDMGLNLRKKSNAELNDIKVKLSTLVDKCEYIRDLIDDYRCVQCD